MRRRVSLKTSKQFCSPRRYLRNLKSTNFCDFDCFPASSMRVQVRSDGLPVSPQYRIDSQSRISQQHISHYEQHRYNGKHIKLTTASEAQSIPSSSPPPLLYVTRKQQSLGSRESRMATNNLLGGNYRERAEEDTAALFEKMQTYRKGLNQTCPPPPALVKDSKDGSVAKHLFRDPPASLFGENVMREANQAFSLKASMAEPEPVVTRNPFSGINMDFASSDISMTVVADRANSRQLGSKRSSPVSKDLVVSRRNKRCSSLPTLPAPDALSQQARMDSISPQTNRSSMHQNFACLSVPTLPASATLSRRASVASTPAQANRSMHQNFTCPSLPSLPASDALSRRANAASTPPQASRSVHQNFTCPSLPSLPASDALSRRANAASTPPQASRSVHQNFTCPSLPSLPASDALSRRANAASTPTQANRSVHQNFTLAPCSLLDVAHSVKSPSRKIEINDSESCGGFAYDHDSMPKIVAVHSVTWQESDTQGLQGEGFPLLDGHSESRPTRGHDRGRTDDHTHSYTQVGTTKSDSRWSHQTNLPVLETGGKEVEMSPEAIRVANGSELARQTGGGSASSGVRHARNDGYHPVHAAESVGAHSYNGMEQHGMTDQTAAKSGAVLAQYASARIDQASVRQQPDNTPSHITNTSRPFECRQAQGTPPTYMVSRAQQTSFENSLNGVSRISGQLSQSSDSCKVAIEACVRETVPSPKPRQIKRSQSVERESRRQKIIEHNEMMLASDRRDELCQKILETRKRSSQETCKWKKKLLQSLEIVFTKRLRKTERDTGLKASIAIPEKCSTTHGHQKEKNLAI